ncbi:MAG: universal stress protein [Burkholderiales bacterium RIFCSPLOWO2_02_FULL_57_36]|nr:MAG: universal stress protein [Burkholderiales bacterium RIFCSPLOWO2_02_FULL_57_36]
MSYKIILVHVDESRHAKARMEFAASMAMDADAHLIGGATTGMSREFIEWIGFDEKALDLDRLSDMLRERAEQSLTQFEIIVRRTGVASFEKRLIEDDLSAGIAMQARFSDLVILTQSDPRDSASGVSGSFPETVVMESGAPALILPYVHDFKYVGERVLVAWNASPEARRAVHYALPLLERARIVEVVVFNAEAQPGIFGDDPGADIALYLVRHGVKVDVLQRTVTSDTGSALVALSNELDSDLIVMGCYGHARLRELLMGGATRTVLKSMTCPVLMSH